MITRVSLDMRDLSTNEEAALTVAQPFANARRRIPMQDRNVRYSADSGGGRAPGYAFGPDRSSGSVRQFEATLASGLEW